MISSRSGSDSATSGKKPYISTDMRFAKEKRIIMLREVSRFLFAPLTAEPDLQ